MRIVYIIVILVVAGYLGLAYGFLMMASYSAELKNLKKYYMRIPLITLIITLMILPRIAKDKGICAAFMVVFMGGKMQIIAMALAECLKEHSKKHQYARNRSRKYSIRDILPKSIDEAYEDFGKKCLA